MFHYLHKNLSKAFIALYIGRLFEFVSLGLLNLFVPIYLFTQFNLRVEYVFLYYLIGYLIYAALLPLGVQYLNIIGLVNSFRLSVFMFAGYLTMLYLMGIDVRLFAGLSLIFLTLARIFFWMPFHVELAELTDKKDRGSELSLMWGTRTLLGIVIPTVSGFLITNHGFDLVYIIGISAYLLAFIPYLWLPQTDESYSWGIRETFRQCFARKNRRLFLANVANGAEMAVGVVIWPIFIWQVLNGNYLEVGVISSLIVLVTVILQLTVGKYTDLLNKRKLLRVGSLLYSFGWIAKIFVLTAGQVFVVGTYHSFAAIIKDTSFNVLNYEILADKGHYIDEYTVVKEVGHSLGKFLMMAFAITVAVNLGLNWTFALAALASLFINIL